jgi:hypothetical protein
MLFVHTFYRAVFEWYAFFIAPGMRYILIILLIVGCRFPHYVPDKISGMESSITDASLYILKSGIMRASADSLQDEALKEKLSRIKADGFEVLKHDNRSFGKPNEPVDSIVVFTRIRKATMLMWGAEDLIYIYSSETRKFPEYSEADGYLFRKITDRIYYRRYYFSST